MARFLASRLQKTGGRVAPLDKPLSPESVAEAVSDADLVLLCVPINAVDQVLETMAPQLDSRTILADISSVKVRPVASMLAAHQGPVVGTHPLFGPNPDADAELRVAVVPARDDSAVQKVCRAFEAMGLQTFLTSAEDHDRAMAYVQGLNFATTLAYLSSAPRDVNIDRFLTPSFARRLAAAKTMCTEDAEMFTAMCEANPAMGDILRSFRSFLNIAAAGDLDLLAAAARWWWPREHIR